MYPGCGLLLEIVTEASRSLISGVPDKRFGSSVDCSTGVCAIREAVQTACVSNSHPVFVWVPQFSLQVHVERSRFSFTTVPHVPPLPFSFCFFSSRLLEQLPPVLSWMNDLWWGESSPNGRAPVKGSVQLPI